MGRWSFLSRHAQVLVCIAHDPGIRLCDIATTLRITERRAYDIVTDLSIGPDGKLYQMGTSPTIGVAIRRYSLGPIRQH